MRERAMRYALAMALAAASMALAPTAATAGQHTHGLSIFGDLKYPVDFTHFDYVNPNAPKGGRLATIGTLAALTFDSFNPFIVRGDAAQGLEINQGFELVFESLMVRAFDEPDAVYGLLADWAEVAGDKRAVTFHIRPEAKWADGTPVTAADCAFSLEALKTNGDPRFQLALRDVVGADVIDPQTVRYRFQGDNVRDLPLRVASLPVFSKAWFTGRDFAKPFLDIPLTSGPYRIGRFEPKSFIIYERRTDYWGKDLPVNSGRYNFDSLKIDYYADRTAGLQALFAGDLDLREEFSSRDWANGYDTAPIHAGKIVRDQPADNSPSGMQGFILNLRLAKFADPRTRIALDYAFDFEWTRKNLFFGSYKRVQSYFENSPLRAEGKPTPAELVLLEPYRTKLPAEVFGDAPASPSSDGSGQDRGNLHKAADLLAAAGWTLKGGKLIDAKGEAFHMEFLLDDGSFERVIGPYIKNLQVLGITANIRVIDPAQYLERQRKFDFDIISTRYETEGLTPGIGLRNLFNSAAADTPDSSNEGGIKDPVVDALVEQAAAAKSRPELETAIHALDRVLRAGHYWVPEWYNDKFRLAYWDRFGHPAIKPLYDRGVFDTWWVDKDKDAKLSSK